MINAVKCYLLAENYVQAIGGRKQYLTICGDLKIQRNHLVWTGTVNWTKVLLTGPRYR
jgi:hypothetical protein